MSDATTSEPEPRRPGVLRGAPIGPLPRGLPAALARLADRASNSADRRALPFDDRLHRFAAHDGDGVLIADLHADTLLWGVDPWKRRASGHVDLPRLFDARVGLMVFGGPTWTPLPMKNREQALCVSCESVDQSDALFPSQWLDRLRRGKGALRRRRAYRLAERFHQMLQQDRRGRLRPILRAGDLQGLARTRRPGPKTPDPVGVMLSLEGAHWIEQDDSPSAIRAEIAALRAAGFRMIAPTHRFANGLGGSSEDCRGRMGLSRAGRAALEAMWDLGLAVDLAHASPALIRDAAGLALTRPAGPRPLIVSHAGARAAHREARNLRDADIRAVASTGGVIGIGVWWEAVGFALADPVHVKIRRIGDHVEAVLAALRHPEFAEEMHDRYGRFDPFEHLAIGSDFDGATATPFDVTGLSHLLTALAQREDAATGAALLPPDKLPLFAGENTRRVLAASLAG